MCAGRELCMFTKETPGQRSQLVSENPKWAGNIHILYVTKQNNPTCTFRHAIDSVLKELGQSENNFLKHIGK